MARISDPIITRRGDVVPGDKQDQPADGQTSEVSFTDGTSINWGDALQHFMLRAAKDLGRVGPLSNRPSAGSDQPVWWLVTDDAAGPYLTFNDGSAWQDFSYIPNDGLTIRNDLEGVSVGTDETETLEEIGAPTGWAFFNNTDRNVHLRNELDISNPSGGSATEDVTVELTDSGSNVIRTETRSISVGAGATTTGEVFNDTEAHLTDTLYEISVTTSGSTLVIDSSAEVIGSAVWQLRQTGDGTGALADGRQDSNLVTFDPVDGAVDVQTSLSVNGDAVATAETAADIREDPNLGISVQVEADGAADDGDHYHHPVTVPDGKTLNVYGVGIAEGDGSAPPTGLDVELNDASKTQLAGPVNTRWSTGDPLWTETNSSGSPSIYFISVDNGTATEYSPSGGGTNFVTLTGAFRVE